MWKTVDLIFLVNLGGGYCPDPSKVWLSSVSPPPTRFLAQDKPFFWSLSSPAPCAPAWAACESEQDVVTSTESPNHAADT